MNEIRERLDKEFEKALVDLEGARNMQVRADAIITVKMLQDIMEKQERILSFRIENDKKTTKE